MSSTEGNVHYDFCKSEIGAILTGSEIQELYTKRSLTHGLDMHLSCLNNSLASYNNDLFDDILFWIKEIQNLNCLQKVKHPIVVP